MVQEPLHEEADALEIEEPQPSEKPSPAEENVPGEVKTTTVEEPTDPGPLNVPTMLTRGKQRDPVEDIRGRETV